MNLKTYILSLAILLIFVSGFGKPVTKKEVAAVVSELLEQWKRPGDVEIERMEARYLSDGSLGYYLVDLGSGGWVLVSGEDVVRPVLAFSFESRLDEDDQWNDAAGYLLNIYTEGIHAARKNPNLQRDVRWDRQQLPTEKSALEYDTIKPFIKAKWNQGSGWNMFCPYDEDGPGDHAYVGCVAVAMAQAMSVYKYPAAPHGIKSYVHDKYGSIAVNYNLADPYGWSQMSLSSYDSYNAILLYHCAVAVEMDFGADGSGSYVRTAANAMKQYFSYSTRLSFKERYTDDEAWKSLLYNELKEKRPIVYRGGPDDGRSGHAWNIDGYGAGYFHMNFGWSGSHNGYYTLDLINPGDNDFSSSQGAMIGIAPPLSAPTDLTLSASFVKEGLPLGSYVADVLVEDEDPNNIYSFTCKGKFSIILDDYRPSSFHIEDGKLLSSEVFVYNEEKPELNSKFLLVIVEDQYGNKFQKEFYIDVEKVYTGPLGIALTDSSIKENQPVGTAVACLMVEDEDPDNSYTYTLFGPYNEEISDYDPASFYMDNDTLRSSVVFDREVADTSYVLVELEDSHGFLLSRAFTIKIESDQSGSTAVIPVSAESDLFFPNPASHLIRLRNPEQISSFELFEISTGRMLMSESTVEESVDVSDLPDGGYLIVIKSDGTVFTQKLLIRH